MQFSEWLDARLLERGWSAADFVRASRDAEHPRGFDPGLVSRWRKPAPLGVVPSRATLKRIAAVLGEPAGEALYAAGYRAEDAEPDERERAREQVNAKRAAVRQQLDAWLDAVGPEYESLFWEKLKADGESNVRFIHSVRTAVSPATHTAVSPGVSRDQTSTNGDSGGRNSPLAKDQRPTRRLLANHQPTSRAA